LPLVTPILAIYSHIDTLSTMESYDED